MLKIKRFGKPLICKRLFHAAEIDICMPFKLDFYKKVSDFCSLHLSLSKTPQ